MNSNLIIIGIAGGSGSGKTRLAKNVLASINNNEISMIEVDSFYRDLSHLKFEEREKNNFDHPDSIDFDELYMNLCDAKINNSMKIPSYDYKTHTRIKDNYTNIENIQILLLEGILALYNNKIRDLMALKIFVDTPSDIRVLRRLKRDVNKRKRTIDSVIKQYNTTVRPMHLRYVEPTKEFADVIIRGGGKKKSDIDMIATKIKKLLY